MYFSLLQEEVYYQRPRGNNTNNPNNVNQPGLRNENESIPQPAGIIPNQYPSNPVVYQQQQNHDQTIAMESSSQNYANIQQQHYIPHQKLHSMDRFAVPSSIMPPPAPQSHNHHEHLTDDHELSLNETDNEDDNYKAPNGHQNQYKPNVEPQTPNNNFPISYGNNGVQLEFSESIDKKKETSIIDLNELDEAQLKQLQAEEEKQQQEYFNIDHLNRLYCQAQFLYKVRGKKLEEVTNRFTAYQEDMSREIRAMKHRVYLVEKDKESVQSSLDQAHALCTQYKGKPNPKNTLELKSLRLNI